MPAAFKVSGSDFLGHEASVVRCLLAVQSSHVGCLDTLPLGFEENTLSWDGSFVFLKKNASPKTAEATRVSADPVNWCLTGLLGRKGGICLQKTL